MKKKKRQKIYEKSNGHCWYCGCDISSRKWHVDHFDPIFRGWKDKPDRAGEDTFNNLVPACVECNLFKKTFSVEQFREELEKQVERARKYSVNFRTAERFGLIEVKEDPVVFWFEKK